MYSIILYYIIRYISMSWHCFGNGLVPDSQASHGLNQRWHKITDCFLKSKRMQILEILLWGRKFPSLPYIQYHGCWWPVDTKSQSISSHDIDLVRMEYTGFNSVGFKNHQQIWFTTVPPSKWLCHTRLHSTISWHRRGFMRQITNKPWQ